MEAQQKISKENLENKIGKEYEVLIEALSFDKKYYIGRTIENVPEIDGLVYIKNENNEKEIEIINQFKKCKIIEVSNYDLIAALK